MFVCWNFCPYWALFLCYHNRSLAPGCIFGHVNAIAYMLNLMLCKDASLAFGSVVNALLYFQFFFSPFFCHDITQVIFLFFLYKYVFIYLFIYLFIYFIFLLISFPRTNANSYSFMINIILHSCSYISL